MGFTQKSQIQTNNIVTAETSDPQNTTNETTKPIEKWSVDDVYDWLSTVHDGDLKELAKITEDHLKNTFDASLGDQLQFDDARSQLFEEHEKKVDEGGNTTTEKTD